MGSLIPRENYYLKFNLAEIRQMLYRFQLLKLTEDDWRMFKSYSSLLAAARNRIY